ncbi:hypothetical protein [Kitasatospora kifunensis]|uniref:Uncharacterized protein n=1 Tax=Kitasatospora kifunensis TaxID=58351 RepID=A0A7W7R0J2_KITKI|nr:hypothetical protein [Kitasatospora kifunensis]MBB4923215.1 hypothetical protein [Kitasatospora kifunensis]
MDESTGSPAVWESAKVAAVSGATPRWFALTGLAAATAGPIAAGLQGNPTVAAISATPSLVLGLAFFVGVICPAIWSRKAQRQKAALNVMNALLGRNPGSAYKRT